MVSSGNRPINLVALVVVLVAEIPLEALISPVLREVALVHSSKTSSVVEAKKVEVLVASKASRQEVRGSDVSREQIQVK